MNFSCESLHCSRAATFSSIWHLTGPFFLIPFGPECMLQAAGMPCCSLLSLLACSLSQPTMALTRSVSWWARQQQPGQGRQVRLSWLQSLCKAIPGIQILFSNRGSANQPKHQAMGSAVSCLCSEWERELCQIARHGRIQAALAQPSPTLPTFASDISTGQATTIAEPLCANRVLFKQSAPILCL